MPALPVIILGLAWPLLLTGPPPGWLPALGLCVAILLVLWPALIAGARWFLQGWLTRSTRQTGQVEKKPAAWRHAVALLSGVAAVAAWHINHGLEQRLSGPYETSMVRGEVASLPLWQGDRLVFLLAAETGPWGPGRRQIEVRWRAPEDPESGQRPFPGGRGPQVGERWDLPLRLMPTRGRINFSGTDRERAWFAARIHGLGTVRLQDLPARRLDAARGRPLGRWRESIRARLLLRLHDHPGAGLVLALGLGERSRLSPALSEAMRGTGTGHLLAISGLHVGLVAVFAFWSVRLLLGLLGWRHALWPAQRAAIVFALLAAALYAGLAGFGTSPRRALVMLTVAGAALLLRRRADPWQGWVLALAVVLMLEPMASLQAGFWLSFGAVAVLLHQFQGRSPPQRGARALLSAQLGLGIAMLPLAMGWFQWVSLSAFVVNLLAIPWVSLITLPLVLLTLLTIGSDAWPAQVLADMAATSALYLEQGLVEVNRQLQSIAWRTARPSPLALLLGLIGGALCLLPRALQLRRFGWLLLLPLLLPHADRPGPGEVRLELLDTGQGQAAFLQTRNHLALVDSGPGLPGQWDLADSVILPAARHLRRKAPDLLLVSHADLDHAGGWPRLAQAWPGAALLGVLPRPAPGMAPCTDERSWAWDGVLFEVLHPTRWLPYRGNDSSCVLAVYSPSGNLLLPGDIGRLVERRLARQDGPAFDVLLAPHHGSRTSSSAAFLDRVRPGVVLVPAGYANRFAFPHREVVQRYEAVGVQPLVTAACGALRVTLRRNRPPAVQSARRARPAFWRWPAARECPGR